MHPVLDQNNIYISEILRQDLRSYIPISALIDKYQLNNQACSYTSLKMHIGYIHKITCANPYMGM